MHSFRCSLALSLNMETFTKNINKFLFSKSFIDLEYVYFEYNRFNKYIKHKLKFSKILT